MTCSVCKLPDQSLCPLKASCELAEYVKACEEPKRGKDFEEHGPLIESGGKLYRETRWK